MHAPSAARFAATPSLIAVAGLVALAVAMGVGRFAFTPLLPMMQEDHALAVAQGGWLAAANYFGYLVGALSALRQVRADLAIRSALLAIALATLGMGLTHDFVSWMVLRAVAGVASAWALVSVSSWCLGQLDRPVLKGTLFAGVGVGIVVAGGACIALMAANATAAQAWLALGVLSLVMTAVVWPVFGVAELMATEQTARHRLSADSWCLVLCYGAFGFGYIIPATFVPAMAKQVIADPLVFGWAWPLFGMTAAASTLVVAPVLRVLSNRRLWMLSAAAMALGVASPLFVPGLTGIVAAAILVGGSFMVITMAGMQEARRVAGGGAPILMAAMTAAFATGQILGPLCVAYLSERPALVVASGLLVLSAAALAKEKR